MSAAEREKSKNAYLRRGLQNTNTAAVDDAASRLWAVYRSGKALPKTPTKEEIEGNGAEAAVLELAIFALSRPIPIMFDANLKPTTDTNRCVTGQTLVEYIGKYLKKLREIDPDHADWKNLKPTEFPPWWTVMRKSILNRSYDNQIKWQGEFEFGAADIRPLYLDLGAVKGDNPLRFCDLKHVIMALVKHADPSNKNIEMAAKIIMTYDSIARGGEVKFQKFTDWSFDYLTYVLDTKWSETKTCDIYAMARVSDKRWWFCFFFIMGAYAMCSNGLYRSEEQIKNGLQYAVFPDLHKYKDNYVTTVVGKWVKQGLDSMNREVPGIDSMTKMFSAKSCRVGAVNELALHSLITVFNVCARSGHSVGERVNALQSYLDRSNPILGLPAALALHGYKCIRPKKVVYPKISAVGEPNMASMKRLICKMFLISIPEFEENGKLRDVLNMFAASLILHYKQLVRDCGPCNQIASKLEECAVEGNITAAGLPNLYPIDVLELYSDKISKKFDEDIKDIEIGDEAAAKGSTEMMQLVGIASDVKDIKATEEEMKVNLATTKQRLERSEQNNKRLKEENAHLHELLQKANEKLAAVKSNCSPVRPMKHQRTPETDEGGNGDANVGDEIDFQLDGEVGVNDFQADEVDNEDYAAKPPPSNDKNEDYATKPPPSKKLRNSNTSESFNARTGDKGLDLVTALESLAERKLVHKGNSLASITIPTTLCENRGHLTHCLALIDFAGPQSDIDKLSKEMRSSSMGEDQETEALHIIAIRLVNSARDKLFEFENTTYEIEQASGGTVPGTTVVGMGNRVRKYRNLIKEARGIADKNVKAVTIALIERSELNKLEKEKAAPRNRTALDTFLVRSSRTNSSNNE